MNRNHKHFYACFWRPDLLPKLELAGTLCGYSIKAANVTVDKKTVTCPQCIELINSSGHITGTDWTKHPGHGGAVDVVAGSRTGRLPAKSDAWKNPDAWTTEPKEQPKPADGWTTKKDDGWTTGS